MRKLLAWLLAALIALSGFAFAEADQPAAQPAASLEQPAEEAGGAAVTADEPVDEPADEPTDEPADEPTDEPVDVPADEPASETEEAGEAVELPTEPPVQAAPPAAAATSGVAYNGRDAARANNAVYMVIPDGERQMLVCVPGEGDPVCVDRGDRIEDLMPYGDGVAYLKTENNSSAITTCNGAQVEAVYAFGASAASALNFYDGKFLVLIDGQLHSIDPATRLCLRLSGSQMMDYVLDGDTAYFLSAGDRMEYTAKLGNGEAVSAQAGCVYSLDLKTGETGLQLKSGVRDLEIAGGKLYFHNLADAYAVRTGDNAQLMGRVNELDLQQHSLENACSEADSGFWALDRGLVVWYGGALNTETEAGTLALYSPENGATVASDGEYLYAWEAGKSALTRVELNGTATALYSGDLTQAQDLSLMVPEASADPSASADPNATPGVPELDSDLDPNGDSNWYDEFVGNQDDSSSRDKGSSSGSAWPGATPIGMTPTPKPTSTPAPTLDDSDDSAPSNGGTSGGSSKKSSSGGSSGGTYSVSISRVKMTGSVNMRSGPGLGYRVKAVLNKGAVVSCTGRASKDSRGRVWYQVKRNGSTGWVSSLYAKKTTASLSSGSSSSKGSTSASGTRYTTGSVNIRSGPGLGYSSKGTIGKGTKLSIKAKSTDSRGVVWYKTSSGGKTGWVSSRYLSTSKPKSGSSSSGGSGGYIVTTGKLTIRAKANKNSAAKGYIGSGKRATYLGSSKKDSRGVRWYKISYKGVTGWISSKYSYRS